MLDDLARFPFVRLLESHFATIRAEMRTVPRESYLDWPLRDAYRGSWRLYALFSRDSGWRYGGDPLRNARTCRRTSELLGRIPGLLLGGFSSLGPDTHIFPHRDEVDVDCVRCHLPLETDGRAGIRFGRREHLFEPGRCVAFLGQEQHESLNLGAIDRVVLLVDVALDQAEAPLLPARSEPTHSATSSGGTVIGRSSRDRSMPLSTR